MPDLDTVGLEIEWPKNRTFQLVGLGLNAVDWICLLPHYPPHNSKIRLEQMVRRGGGQVATACALCARYGLQVRYLGRIGDDEIGQCSRRDLEREPMDLQLEVVPGARSQFALILVDRPTGERTILWDRDPGLLYGPGELERDWIVDGQLLHLDGHDQAASIQAARWAREAGMKVFLDIDTVQPGVEELLELTDFLVPSLDFLCAFSGERDWRTALRKLGTLTDGLVVVTRGNQGAAALWEDTVFEVPALPIKATDTTGAGDVFHGALAYGLLKGLSLGACLRLANTAAGLACTRLGARGGIPSLEEVQAQLESAC